MIEPEKYITLKKQKPEPKAETPGLLDELEAQGFRPFGYEW